ncbi:hypothetical protein U9M48_000238 [Paspalum notatum var. saurae]|uniref:Powdery mildew resistance protein n=1 Tax=Paspalum notatum var. saurae TaxID=547442 RepID=A0AAQ3PGQ7_PASNO
MAELAAGMVVGPLLSLLEQKASNYLLDKYKVMEGMEKQREVLEHRLMPTSAEINPPAPMAELATSMVVGPLLSLVKDKVTNYLLEQYKVMEGMEKHHRILKRKLPAILDIVADAEKQASRREGVKAWLEELKTAAYEANDVFDEFQMGNKLSAIVETIEVLVAEMNAFGFKHQLEAPPACKEWRETDHNINGPENIVRRSRDQERNKIVEMLLNGQACNDGDLMVIPIVGMGGLGKTTLAQLIYNDPQVKEHFQLQKWVCVSNDFNVRDLANKICNASEKSLEEAFKKLQDELKGKRYLLVLDDVWNKDVNKWEKIKAYLKHGGVGSAILTTRDKEIAEFMGTIVDNSGTNKYHDVSVLGEEFIKEIIETRAFSLQGSKRDELVSLVSSIAERCVGSPLAAKALGSVLRNKTTKQEWEAVLQRSSICSDETGILPDYEIDMNNLIQLWMASGFIFDQKKVPAETVGEQIIKEMVSSGRHCQLTVKPKHLHHLRYLDLSNSEMEALPDDISILYNLQTLKLSGCERLRGLPKQMKYMTALRHLYTDRCDSLMGMPAELGRLSSLQTVTCFVVGSGGGDCSGLEELKDLNIGGSLELTQLENVAKATSARSANLGKKKELRQLSLRWTCGEEEQQEETQCVHDEVLEALEAHDGLLALEISSYQGNRFPSWMGRLRNVVELRLFNCTKTEQLPPFSQLPGLQVLCLGGLGKLLSLCSRCTSSSMFGKLKYMILSGLDGFDSFFSEAGQGEVVAFPQLEELYVRGCRSLKALPEGAMLLSETHGGRDNNAMSRSAFPRLKKLTLDNLRSFERWEAADDALEIKAAEQPRVLLFPLLETVCIRSCPQLATLPRAPKLGELELSDVVKVDDGKQAERSCWDHMSSVTFMRLYICDSFFLGSRALLALWACFGQLQDLAINRCDKLVYWPEKEFRGLVSLRTLSMAWCGSLIGYAAHTATDKQETTSEEERRRSQLLPRLESLEIFFCQSLVEVLSAPAALKRMRIGLCGKLDSLSLLPGKQQDKTPSPSSLKHHHQGGSSSTDAVTASTAAGAVQQEDLSPPAASTSHQDNVSLLPSSSSLESLEINCCFRLSEVRRLPPSLRQLKIDSCSNLRLLSGQLDALKEISISRCPELRSLESIITSGPVIRRCPAIKSLPPALQQRLDSLEEKELDAHLEATAVPAADACLSVKPAHS